MKKELAVTYENWGKLLEKQKSQLAAALPSHVPVDRMVRLFLTEFRANHQLLECSQQSIMSSLLICAQLGVEPGNALGQAYFLPYRSKSGMICQFILGYRGMIALARRSGDIISLSAHEVYENDVFEFEYGLEDKLKHKPALENRGTFIGAYAVAKLKDGGHQFEFMSKADLDKIKSMSKSGASNYSPWATAYEEMCKKTVIRRLFKYLPVSIEIQRAVTFDEAADVGNQTDYMSSEIGEIFDNELIIEEHDQKSTLESEIDKGLNDK